MVGKLGVYLFVCDTGLEKLMPIATVAYKDLQARGSVVIARIRPNVSARTCKDPAFLIPYYKASGLWAAACTTRSYIAVLSADILKLGMDYRHSSRKQIFIPQEEVPNE